MAEERFRQAMPAGTPPVETRAYLLEFLENEEPSDHRAATERWRLP